MVEAEPEGESSWMDEIDFHPAASWLRMGTRDLGSRPWLVIDDRRDAELALKATLLADRHSEVFAAMPGTEGPGQAVLDLVADDLAAGGLACQGSQLEGSQLEGSQLEGSQLEGSGLAEPATGAGNSRRRHPLDIAGRRVQEDLCLLRHGPQGWILVAASLCFPSRWRLADKMGLPLHAIHRPVAGYQERLAKGVDRLLSSLGSRIVLRRNWFIHPDANLFQPDRPIDGDPVIDADSCPFELYLRSERQTLRRIDDDHTLFTIRVQQDRLETLILAPERYRSLCRFVAEASEEKASHHGLGPAQRRSLRSCLVALHR